MSLDGVTGGGQGRRHTDDASPAEDGKRRRGTPAHNSLPSLASSFSQPEEGPYWHMMVFSVGSGLAAIGGLRHYKCTVNASGGFAEPSITTIGMLQGNAESLTVFKP